MNLTYGVTLEATETFRWAMRVDPFGYGLNAQTIPKSLRYMFVAPKGRVLCAGDLSQAEARVVAYLARCKDLIEIFNDPTRSVHLENALAVFGHAVKKDTPEYVLAKSIVHGSNYRMGPFVLSTSAGIPVVLCRKLMGNYNRKRPELHKWHDVVWNEIKDTGRLKTPLGDERQFYEAASCFSMTGKMTDQQWKDAIAWVPQTTVPHVLNIGLIEMYKWKAQGRDIWFHHQGHDSFLVSVPMGEEVRFFDDVHKIYSAIKLFSAGGTFVIPTEYQLGYNFGDMFNYNGSCLILDKWQDLVKAKLDKMPRNEQILGGTYSVHLKDWRP